MNRLILVLATAVTAGLVAGQAWAHGGSGGEATLASALAHPLTGIDHLLLAMGVGLYAAWLGRRAAWTLPVALAASAAAGVGFAAMPWELPLAHHEAATMGVLGAVLCLAFARPRLALAVPTVALAALIHGHAHGAQLVAASGALSSALVVGATTWGLAMTGVGLARLMGPTGSGIPVRALGAGIGAAVILLSVA